MSTSSDSLIDISKRDTPTPLYDEVFVSKEKENNFDSILKKVSSQDNIIIHQEPTESDQERIESYEQLKAKILGEEPRSKTRRDLEMLKEFDYDEIVWDEQAMSKAMNTLRSLKEEDYEVAKITRERSLRRQKSETYWQPSYEHHETQDSYSKSTY